MDESADDKDASSMTWGERLVLLLEKIGPIELLYPEIEDATEWVKQIRRDQDERRGLKWDDDE